MHQKTFVQSQSRLNDWHGNYTEKKPNGGNAWKMKNVLMLVLLKDIEDINPDLPS